MMVLTRVRVSERGVRPVRARMLTRVSGRRTTMHQRAPTVNRMYLDEHSRKR